MKVKIRSIESLKAVDFCEIPWGTDPEALLGHLKSWGGVLVDGSPEETMYYQVVLDADEAYLEIVVGEEQ